ncbi:hypothetical protein F4804DRAFT_329541 [Jackrogersella minutella]|nr:hypothetical protein F4804DRAFT_329541 [Jackrogersella minutella]
MVSPVSHWAASLTVTWRAEAPTSGKKTPVFPISDFMVSALSSFNRGSSGEQSSPVSTSMVQSNRYQVGAPGQSQPWRPICVLAAEHTPYQTLSRSLPEAAHETDRACPLSPNLQVMPVQPARQKCLAALQSSVWMAVAMVEVHP